MKTRPPAVAMEPPIFGLPVFCIPSGKPSVTPSGTSQATSPVLTLIANRRPHGGALQGQLVFGSQNRLTPATPARVYGVRALSGFFTIWFKLPKSIVLTNKYPSVGSKEGG